MTGQSKISKIDKKHEKLQQLWAEKLLKMTF